jgi:hypothetical protein
MTQVLLDLQMFAAELQSELAELDSRLAAASASGNVEAIEAVSTESSGFALLCCPKLANHLLRCQRSN